MLWIQGRSVMKRGGGRPVAFLSKVSLRTELPKTSLRGFQTCVALVMLSCGASVAVFSNIARAASFALTLTPRARTDLSTGASGLVASTWKPAIFAPILALMILVEAEGGVRRELESCWCSGSPCVS